MAIIPLLAVPLLVDLGDGVERVFLTLDWFIWAAFAAEYVVRLILTAEKWRFVRKQWMDLVIVAIPFLRPLRIARSARALRLLRLAWLGALFGRIAREARRLLIRRKFHYVILVATVVVIGSAGLVFALEDGSDGSIDSFGDALWWAITTVTTVGYGDEFPVTAAGRMLAAFLMLVGIALLGVVTANIAALFLERAPEEEQAELDRLDEILARLEAIEQRLAARERA